MNKKYTNIHDIYIKKFRGLNNVEIPLGERITLLCGKNGTSKSTILGILAQMFNFDKDLSKDENDENFDLNKYIPLVNGSFISKLGDHFRLSPEHDTEMDVSCNLYDGIENIEKTDIKLKFTNSRDRAHKYQRPVVRKNIDKQGNYNSRKIVHPVIYLSTKRLFPIPLRENYKNIDIDYIQNFENQQLIKKWTNKILVRDYEDITCTTGDINSALVHNDKYDYHSASVGEDNLGQILLSILSFKKLEEEYINYSGGLLLIDEIDASLFPGAQIELFKILTNISKTYHIQIVATTHSFDLIEYFSNLTERDNNLYKLHFLTNAYGDTVIKQDYNLARIQADLRAETIQTGKNSNRWPKINLYLEDDEAKKFFDSLIRKNKIRHQLNIQGIELGCEELKNLRNKGIIKSEDIVILDGDCKLPTSKTFKNFCQLPSDLPPDQLLYDILAKLPADHKFWDNDNGFTHEIFIRIKNQYLSYLPPEHDSLLYELEKIRENKLLEKGEIRQSFKNFYKDKDIQRMLRKKDTNPFHIWIENNPKDVKEFQEDIITKLKTILANYGISKKVINDFFD